jgi:hypothetical protein
LAACLALVLAATATAATVRVTGEKIDGLGEAIIAAEPGDTILIPAGEYLLTQGDVLEEKDLTLRGAGESQTTVVPSGGGDALNDPGVRTLALSIGAPLKPPEDADPEESASIDPKARIIALIATLGIFGLVLELVRRRRLVERYALLWMSAAVAMLVLSIWTGALDIIANLMGIAEPANAIFSLAFGVAFLLLLNFSVVSSRLSEESKVLAQEVARLEQELRLERSLRGGDGLGFSKPPGGSAGAEDSQDEPPVRAE